MRGLSRRCLPLPLFFALMAMLAGPLLLSVPAMAAKFDEPLEGLDRVEPAHVVRFQVLSVGPQSAEVKLETRADFKIYNKSLLFEVKPVFGDSWQTGFQSRPEPASAHDPWYDEVRATHSSGAVFTLDTGTPLAAEDQIRVRIEACSDNMCLLPVWFAMPAVQGALSVQAERAKRELGGFAQDLGGEAAGSLDDTTRPGSQSDPGRLAAQEPQATSESPAPPQAEFREARGQPETVAPSRSVREGMSLSDRVTLFVQDALSGRSFWLFPALFLAGLLMNLTPCVYPMIPITLNVLGRLGHRSGAAPDEGPLEGFVRASIYVLGIVLTYSLMGVVAGMTGTLFGSLLQSETVLVGLAVLFVALGLGMLGVIDLTRIQVWASRIPISDKSPHLGVFTMGAVSGLVSAPCTGPVLSAILVLIGQSKDPVYGLSLMSFFSLGFGAPYLVLGLFAHNLKRLPRAGRLLDFVKLFFAALLFGLALYYLKFVVGGLPILERAYENPGLQGAALCAAVAIICWQIASASPQPDESVKDAHRRHRRVRLGRLGLIIALSQLSLWFTLYVTKGFIRVSESPSSESQKSFYWVSNWESAKALAKGSGKGLLVDAWAEWCAACLEMDAELWPEADVVARVTDAYIPVKLDFTKSSSLSDAIAERWGLTGLPAVALFGPGDDFDGEPTILFRQKVEKRELFEAMDTLSAPNNGTLEGE